MVICIKVVIVEFYCEKTLAMCTCGPKESSKINIKNNINAYLLIAIITQICMYIILVCMHLFMYTYCKYIYV